MKAVAKFVFGAVLTMGIILGIVGGIMRAFFVTPVTITHNGMAPTLLAGEKAFMWRDAEPELGSIAVCRHPSTGEAVIGRVIGLPGVEIATNRDQLTVAGRTPSQDLRDALQFFNSDTNRQESVQLAMVEFGNTDHQVFIRQNFTFRLTPTTVPNGSFYLLGDNRGDATHDSRSFGVVQAAECMGTLFMRADAVEVADLDHGWLDIL